MSAPKDAPYWRVLEHVLQDIRDGVYAPGDQLPVEEMLAHAYGCSRATVSRVMLMLRFSGLLVGRPGVAATVTGEPMRRRALRWFDYAAETRRRNELASPDQARPFGSGSA